MLVGRVHNHNTHTLSQLPSPLTVIIAVINSTMLWRVLLFSPVVLQCLCNGAQTFPVIVCERPRESWVGVVGCWMVEGLVARVWQSRQPEYLGHTHTQIHTMTGWLAVNLSEADQCEQDEYSLLHWTYRYENIHKCMDTRWHTHTLSTGGDVCMCVCVSVCVCRRADRPGPSNLFPPWSWEIHRMQRGSLAGVGKGNELSGKEWLHSVWQWLKHCREVRSLDSDKRVGWRWDEKKGGGWLKDVI